LKAPAKYLIHAEQTFHKAYQERKHTMLQHDIKRCTPVVNKELSDLWKIPTPEGHSISEPFGPEELAAALRCLKPGKSPGLDSIFPEFIPHTRSALKSWLCVFLSFCMRQLKIPKIRRRALIVAIPKPEKPLGDPKSYCPKSLLCVPFKFLETHLHSRQTNLQPIAPSGAGGLSTREVDRRPGHLADAGHRG